MATGSGAFSAKPGFNQSAGGNYIVITTIAVSQIFDVPAGAGSGGATTFPAPVAQLGTGTTTQYPMGLSSCVVAGSLLKDMGKTYVSSGRTFRKFQALKSNLAATNGVTGQAAGSLLSTAGYFTFYLETGREGTDVDGATNAVIARYF